jgi:hypothetical protein
MNVSKDVAANLKARAKEKDEALIQREKPWSFFSSPEEYEGYFRHDYARILLIAKTLGLPRFMPGATLHLGTVR